MPTPLLPCLALGLLATVAGSLGCAVAKTPPPAPYGALPEARHLLWHELEFYGFVHFTTNTFTDKEWGYGDESPAIFNPTDFDADQIVRTCAEAGMTAIIPTCKHHDGFCLWPSDFTDHDVAASPWKDGQGDLLREISDACQRYGLKFGIYLSPWDRNHPHYGGPEYIEYYRNQLRELLTEYGPIFEVWWDGANGGDGYYGGARETRRIDRSTYYGWDETTKIVRELQPDAVIFSDAGDVRWVGNERGIAGDPCWATFSPRPRPGEKKAGPGTVEYSTSPTGTRDGARWMPAECDVSIRPGWFYHASQDEQVKTPEQLVDLYYASIGRGGSFLLNIPPDRRGRIHENDVASLQGMRRILDATFEVDLAQSARLAASAQRGEGKHYAPQNVLDGDTDTYWSTDDGVTTPEIVLEWGEPVSFNVVNLREHLPLGQRITAWALDAWEDGAWREFAAGQAIGARRLWRGDFQTTTRLRIRITEAPVCPALCEVSVHAEPPRVTIVPEARVFIGKTRVELEAEAPGWAIRYTLDGSPPTLESPVYHGPIAVSESCTLQAVASREGALSPRISEVELVGYDAASLRDSIVFVRPPDRGLAYACYEAGWQTLDQMRERQPTQTGLCEEIDLRVRSRDEHIAVSYTGFLQVPRDGIYEFATASDDGSRLFLHGDLVVENDGLHGMVRQSGSVGLKAGYHPIRVEWFNATGGLGLRVEYAGPGIEMQAIPREALYR